MKTIAYIIVKYFPTLTCHIVNLDYQNDLEQQSLYEEFSEPDILPY